MVNRIVYFLFILLLPLLATAKSGDLNEVFIEYNPKNSLNNVTQHHLWQRQLLTVKLDVVTTHEFSYLKTESRKFDHFKIEYKLSKPVKLENKRFKKSINIYIWPLNEGIHKMVLPTIELFLSARSIQSIHVPEQTFIVKPLPEYLPPGFPVGKIKIDTAYTASSLLPFVLTTNHLASYKIKISSNGLHPDFIPDYANYLTSRDITHLPVSDKKTNLTGSDSFLYSQELSIPIVPKRTGIVSFDTIKISSFDPVDSKIVSYYLKSNHLISINTGIQIALLLVVLLFIYLVIYFLITVLSNLCYRRLIWKRLHQSNSADELSSALMLLTADYSITAKQRNINHCLNLSSWALDWPIENISSYIHDINQLKYSTDKGLSFTEIKSGLLTIMKKHDCFVYYLSTS